MKATTVKQLKFNRGQVSHLLSERVDMGLQNACGTVYNNIYINRYGQLQNAPVPICCYRNKISSNLRTYILCMFDTGGDNVFPIAYDPANSKLQVLPAISKKDPYYIPTSTTPILEYTFVTPTLPVLIGSRMPFKTMQFGYNVLIYGQSIKPIMFNLVPASNNDWSTPTLTVKETYFDNAFDKIFVRGLNTATPSDFTVPTTGVYQIVDQTGITVQKIVTVSRNGAGGAFTQSLVGQVLLCPKNGGALQVLSVTDADNLEAFVLSPLTILNASDSNIKIPFPSSKWVFGYEAIYGDTAGPNNTPSYPDSAVYVNQRLVFGGNDYHGNMVSASRIGVINDFDPESATESDSFSVAIASKDYCRIVDMTVSNNELRIACTNGEYAMSLSNLTPTGSLGGFDLRSEVGVEKDTTICDCGGLTAYVSKDGASVYGTQFSLLRDRYQPISLTSQTEGIVKNCKQLVYLTNRKNSEGNCLVGLNSDGSMFVGNIDLNSGVIGLTKIDAIAQEADNRNFYVERLYPIGDCLYATIVTRFDGQYMAINRLLVRFVLGETFVLPTWYNYWAPGEIIPGTAYHPNDIVIPANIRTYVNNSNGTYRALYYNANTKEYELIEPTGSTYNSGDDTYSLLFDDSVDKSNIVVAGFVRQSDWRSVEIGVGLATRELNKRIVKMEGIIEPTQITGGDYTFNHHRFGGLTLTYEETKDFIMLTKSKDVETMDLDNLSNTSYTEGSDMVWRRAFDNPDRELHYGVSMITPFLVKSLTTTIEYDEVQ